jgi:hypothetical protein
MVNFLSHVNKKIIFFGGELLGLPDQENGLFPRKKIKSPHLLNRANGGEK